MIRGNRARYRQLAGCGLNLFTRDELDQIHYATLEVLEETGLFVDNAEAREIYYSHGCRVDNAKKIVRIPPYVVEEAIRSAPPKVVCYGRDPKYDLVLEGNRVAFINFAVGIKMRDLETGEVRESTKQDVAETALLCDALSSVDAYDQAVIPRDVPAMVANLHAAEVVFDNTTKPVFTEAESGLEMRALIRMGEVIAGGAEQLRRRPIIWGGGCPVSPLQLSDELCELLIEAARAGLPCLVLSQALTGASAPVTLAGGLIVHNCEVLGGIVLTELVRKGTPVVYGSSTGMFDLSCVNVPMGSPELALMSAAVAYMSQYYNLPSFVAGT